VQRCHDAVRDVRTIELSDQFPKHALPLLLNTFLGRWTILGPATQAVIAREVSPFH
jgi:hypothetical protein